MRLKNKYWSILVNDGDEASGFPCVRLELLSKKQCLVVTKNELDALRDMLAKLDE